MHRHCNDCCVFPRLLFVRENLYCAFLEWSHGWSTVHCKNAILINYFESAGHKTWGIDFPGFEFGQIQMAPTWETFSDSPCMRLDEPPLHFHCVHRMPLSLVILQFKCLFPQIIIISRTLPNAYSGIGGKADSQSVCVQWMNSLAWHLARSTLRNMKW